MREVVDGPRRDYAPLIGPTLPPSDLLSSDAFAAFLDAQDACATAE